MAFVGATSCHSFPISMLGVSSRQDIHILASTYLFEAFFKIAFFAWSQSRNVGPSCTLINFRQFRQQVIVESLIFP